MGETPSINSYKVGERIRQIRKAKKLSMKDLAKQVGVSFSYIAKIETGQNRINVEMLYSIAGSLRVSLDSLLSPDDEENEKFKARGWYTLKDFFVVRYDSLGRPEKAYYEIQNQEANVIGQLREIQEQAPEIAQAIFQKFDEYSQKKDSALFSEWFSRGASKEGAPTDGKERDFKKEGKKKREKKTSPSK